MMESCGKRKLAKEWLIFLCCFVPSVILLAYTSKHKPVIGALLFIERRDTFIAWMLALSPYLFVQFIRSIIWAIKIMRSKDKPIEVQLQGIKEVQEQVRHLVKRGVIFSILWLGGIGSLIAIVSGIKARKIIKQSSTPIQGIRGVWWCLIVGGVGVLLWFPILLFGVINNLK